jgi:hypothetical protein
VNVAVPADVDPEDFPNDTYAFDLAVYVSYPSEVVGDRDHPVIVGMAADDRLGQWNLDTERVASDGDSSNLHRVTAVFSRGWDYSAFVYVVSLMPAVIGLGFMIRRQRKPNPGDTAAALELAAALLALIALRQVFVPANIAGLTRLDVLLGVQLALLCAAMAVTYVRTPEPAPPPASPPSPPAPPTPPPPAERSTAANVALALLVGLGFLLGRRRTKR